MCFAAFLKKGIPGLLLAGLAMCFSGCGDASSTPPAKTTTPSTATPTVQDSKPKVNSDGSVTTKPESSAGSEMAPDDGPGRETPEPAPAEESEKPADEKPKDE